MKGTILIVEDQPHFREGLKVFIERESVYWRVVGEAETGEEGWRKVQELSPDLVLLDIHMPVMNGIELARNIHQFQADAMFVVITGHQDFQYAQSALRYGALDLLLKPCSDEDISRILQDAYLKLVEKRSRKQARREHLLRSILFKFQVNEEMKLQLAETFGNRRLWLFAVRDYFPAGKTYREEDIYLLQYGILNIIQELIRSEVRPVEVLVLTADQFVLSMQGAEIAEEAEGVKRMAGVEAHEDWALPIIQAVKAYLGIEMECQPLGDCENIPALLSAYVPYQNGFHQGGKSSRSLPEMSNRQAVHEIKEQVAAIVVSGDSESLAAYAEEMICQMEREPLAEAKIMAVNHALALSEISSLLFASPAQPESVAALLGHIHGIGDAAALFGWLHTLYGSFMERFAEWKRQGNQSAALFDQAIAYIHTHYTDDLSLRQVAEHVHLNPSYFSTLFKKETGETFTNYVTRMKLQRAQVLLRNTDMKMTEICQTVGFEDSAYFSSIFKKFFNMSPSEFRLNAKHTRPNCPPGFRP